MKKNIIVLCALAVSAAAAIVSCTNSVGTENKKAAGNTDTTARVARGQYLVTVIGCDDCHSPKRMGAHGPEIIPELRFSGFPKNGKLPPAEANAIKNGWALFSPDLTATVGPWGTTYAANITSDQTGIGNWKEENFILAMREGIAKGIRGNRQMLPPMPWFNFRNMSDEDLKSIFAYLKTTKAVDNVVPQPEPPAAAK